ncbi:RICIN domain-containing protein [Sorangium sp. So ce1024]|uniref:RICIN domain-containing protein n=1 Tax=Sorangium sp. So ce1024 TaxID=3133327 RepID=UPI003EFF7E84
MIINRATGQPLDYEAQEGQEDRLILFSRVAIFAPAQRWRIEWLNAEQTLARITNYHTHKAIDFVGFNLERPPGVLIGVVDGATAQRWYVDRQPGGSVVLRNFHNNKVLDFP